MSIINQIESPVMVESPKIIPNEVLFVYVPKVSYNNYGIAKFNSKHFNINSGLVSLKELDALSDGTFNVGNNVAGLRGYYWSDIDLSTNKITLDTCLYYRKQIGTNSKGEPIYSSEIDYSIKPDGIKFGSHTDNLVIPWEEGDVISIHNDMKHLNCSTITAVEGNTITVDSLPFDSLIFELDVTDNAVFVQAKPDAGLDTGSVDFGMGAVAFGEGNESTNYMTFNAGFDNVAEGQYSANFGTKNIAGYCSLNSGKSNVTRSDQTFSTGSRNTSEAGANASVLYGIDNVNHAGKTSAEMGKYSMLGGQSNHNYANASVLGGKSNYNYKAFSNLHGQSNYNYGESSGIGGTGNYNSGLNSLLYGSNNKNYCDDSILSGVSNTNDKDGRWSILAGTGNTNYGERSVLFGMNNKNYGYASGGANGGQGCLFSGYNNVLDGGNGVALFGNSNHNISGSNSLLCGISNVNWYPGVFLAGTGNRSSRPNQTLVGAYSDTKYNPLFAVGNGDNDSNRKNAFEVLPDGIRIGNTKITESQFIKILALLN